MNTKLEILVSKDYAKELKDSLEKEQIETSLAVNKNFDGETLASIIILLTPPVCALIANLYKNHVAARQFIKLKYKGFEIEGVSETTLLKLLKDSDKPSKTIDDDSEAKK